MWSKPVRQVATDIRVSDVAVAKACRKHKIPIPWRGYWAIRQHGHNARKPPLPALPGGGDPSIGFHSRPHPEASAPASPELEFERQPENRVTIPENLDRLHRAVRHTRAVLRSHKPDEFGLLRTWAKDCSNVAVAPTSLDRAIRILQALADAFEKRGHQIVEGDESRSGLRVKVQEELLTVSLTERVKQVRHVVTEREEIRQELDPPYQPPKHDWVPTGVLALRIVNAPSRPQHATWRDRAKLPLEDRLNEFLAGLAESAKALKEQREEAERQRQRWAEEEKRRQEKEQRAQVVRARFRFLEEQARLWRRRQQVLNYVAEVRARLDDPGFKPEERACGERWLEWADDYLKRRDPAGLLFWNALIERDDRLFSHYAWSGGYGQRDEWFDLWKD